MKRQIRSSVFETNSSSTHAICISKNRIKKGNLAGKSVTFTHGEFGWENEEYDSVYDKASYLYQAIWSATYPERDYDWNDEEDKNNYNLERIALIEEKCEELKNILDKYGVDYNFTDEHYEEDGWEIGYIDHGNELSEWVDKCFRDEEYLLTYLFGDSFIITGNDNGDEFRNRMNPVIGTSRYGYEEYDYSNYKAEFDDYDVYEKGN